MTKIEITQENSYFLINGKKYVDCNPQEQEFFRMFVLENRPLIERILYVPPKDVEILK